MKASRLAAKDVGDAALKDLVPYIGVALVLTLASSNGVSDSFLGQVDKSPYHSVIQMIDESQKVFCRCTNIN